MPSLGIHLNGKTYAWAMEFDVSGPNDRCVGARIGRLFSRFKPSRRNGCKMPVTETNIPAIVSVIHGQTVVDASVFFSEKAKDVVLFAHELASRYGHEQIEPLHLFIGSIEDENVAVVFGRLNIAMVALKEAIKHRLETRVLGKPTCLSEGAETVLMEAFRSAMRLGRLRVSTLEIFAACYQQDDFLRQMILDLGIEPHKFLSMVEWLRIHERAQEMYEHLNDLSAISQVAIKRARSFSQTTPRLDSVSQDLTDEALNGRLSMLIARENETNDLLRLIQDGGVSVALVGADGVGKLSILAGLAQTISAGEAPEFFQDKRLVRLSVYKIVDGASVAEAVEKMRLILDEVARTGNIILVISDIEQLVIAQNKTQDDLASLLADYISRANVLVIATTNPENYSAYVERSVLGGVFEKIEVMEPDLDVALRVLQSKISTIEQEFHVIFTFDSVASAVELSDRYIHQSFLPKKAIEVARDAAIIVSQERGIDALVRLEDIVRVIYDKTGIRI
jgi:ATP-dependent Clp protease ATP-binding subunit ClpC